MAIEGLTTDELRVILPTDERNALVLLARWSDRDKVAEQLKVSELELSAIEKRARQRIARAAARKAESNGASAAVGGSADVDAERARLRQGLPPRRSSDPQAAKRLADHPVTSRGTPRRRRPKGMRAALFRGALLDGDLTQAEIRRELGIASADSERLKDELIAAGHVVETGELREKSPVLSLTDLGCQADTLRSGVGAGPAAAEEDGRAAVGGGPVADHEDPFAGRTTCPLCGGTLSDRHVRG